MKFCIFYISGFSYYAMIFLIAIPVFLLLILLEYFIAYRRKQEIQNLGDTVNNLNIGVGSQVVGLLYKGFILGIFFWVYEHLSFFQLPITWWSVLACFVGFDFLFYWAHRLSHEVNFLWAAHAVHHQSDEYNLSVALRQSWIHNLLSFAIFLPLPLLGFDPILIGIVSLISTLYQFWIHTRLVDKMPKWFEFIFNTPSHHRVHHAVNEKYLDKNHGAVLILWDRLFGTFQEEEEAPVYGVTNQFKSLNPLYANYEHFASMWREMKHYNWRNKLKILIKPPGWQAQINGVPKYQVDLNRKKYLPEAPLGFKIYALVQFLLILWGTISYLQHFESMAWTYRLLFAALIILSAVISSGFLENKKWVYFAEFGRLPLIFFSLNLFYYFQFIDWFAVMGITSVILFLVFAIWFGITVKLNYRRLLEA